MELKKEFSAGGVIVDGTNAHGPRALLIRIRQEAFEIPKGHVEPGESNQEAAIRECIEEVGCTSELETKEKVGEVTYRFPKDQFEVEKKVTYFRIECLDEFQYSKPKRTREVKWIGLGELETIQLVSEELRAIIANALTH